MIPKPKTMEVVQESQPVQEAAVTEQIPGKVVLSFKEPTPKAAIWAFRGFFGLTGCFLIWLTATTLISKGNKFEISIAVAALDRFALIIANGFGIKQSDIIPNFLTGQPIKK